MPGRPPRAAKRPGSAGTGGPADVCAMPRIIGFTVALRQADPPDPRPALGWQAQMGTAPAEPHAQRSGPETPLNPQTLLFASHFSIGDEGELFPGTDGGAV